MKSTFKDTKEGWKQEYIFATLLSLAKLSDAYSLAQRMNGMAKRNIMFEMQFHYEMAIRTLLKMLGIDSAVGRSIITDENMKLFSCQGIRGMEEFIDHYEEYLQFEEEEFM